jgi:hypothetical protein
MSKKILHFQIPLLENKHYVKDALAISPELLGKFLTLIKDKLGEEFVVITSPCCPGIIGDDTILYNFDLNQISLDELKEMLNKGE